MFHQSQVRPDRRRDALYHHRATAKAAPTIVIKPSGQLTEGYISQVHDLPLSDRSSLVNEELIGEFASYAYNSDRPTPITLRWDIDGACLGQATRDSWTVTTKTST